MALSNLAPWSRIMASPSCRTACGAADKPSEAPTACGAADKPSEAPTACGAADR